MTNHIRNGKGHNHYRRLQAAAKAQAKATNARCAPQRRPGNYLATRSTTSHSQKGKPGQQRPINARRCELRGVSLWRRDFRD